MVLILTSTGDQTSRIVLDWIFIKEEKCSILNTQDIFDKTSIQIPKNEKSNYEKSYWFRKIDKTAEIDMSESSNTMYLEAFYEQNKSYFWLNSPNDIEIIMPWVGDYSIDEYKKLVHNHQRIWSIRIFNAPFDRIDFIDHQKHHPITYTTSNIEDNTFCGSIFPTNFRVNIKMFTEAQHFNTYLNRKITIAEDGEIKNCPSMHESFGNVKTDDILQAVKTEEFQKKWHIKKDHIIICKDCEFRYMCLNCRAYLDKNQEDNQPVKCNYNPYIGKWRGQEGYVPVKQMKQ